MGKWELSEETMKSLGNATGRETQVKESAFSERKGKEKSAMELSHPEIRDRARNFPI